MVLYDCSCGISHSNFLKVIAHHQEVCAGVLELYLYTERVRLGCGVVCRELVLWVPPREWGM